MEDSPQSKGGNKRAERLTAERKKEIAASAAQARWDRELLLVESDQIKAEPYMVQAHFRGQLDIVGLHVPCYVLADGQRVIGRAAVTDILAHHKGGQLEQYISTKTLSNFIDVPKIVESLVSFRIPGMEGLEIGSKGISADAFIEICQGFVNALRASLSADPKAKDMTERQKEIAFNASIFLSACAKVGLESLIDEATGYQQVRASDALQVKLLAFIAEELRGWEKTFPDELWMELGRLTKWKGTLQSRPKWWGRLVIELIYNTLDQEIADYLKNNKPPKGVRWHQQLTENIGIRKLVSRCYEVIGLAKSCDNLAELQEKVHLHYGQGNKQPKLPFPKKPRVANSAT